MKRVIVLPFSLLIVFLFLSPLAIQAAPNPNDPQGTSESMENSAIEKANSYREELGLPLFQPETSLNQMAENHAQYLQTYPDDGHFERRTESEPFTGYSVKHRADHVDFTGVVGEGITYQEHDGTTSIDHLFDAPYHRLNLLDPRYTQIGIAQNNNGDFVANYGGDGILKEPEAIVYPYPDQQDVKVSWFANESPNPLRFFDENRIWTGYPISYRYFGLPKDELVIDSASLINEEGEKVAAYTITPSMEDHGDDHLFLIPKKKLNPGENYHVRIKAWAAHADGTKEDVSKSWDFTTAERIGLDEVFVQKQKETTFLKLEWTSGADPEAIVALKKDGRTYIEKEDNQQYTYHSLEPGTYQLHIDSPWFGEEETYEVVIKQNAEDLQVASFQTNEVKSKKATVKDDYTEFSIVKQVDSGKLWTITFSEEMKVAKEEIYIIDEKEEKVDVMIGKGKNSNQLIVHPPEGGYSPGMYQLMIDPMESKVGQVMNSGVRMQFSVK